jgi:GNAT superfamily N-acetyltransferase
MEPVLSVSSVPEPIAQTVIADGLNAFNDEIVGYSDRVPLHVLVTDPDNGDILGGLSGRTSLGLMFIDVVYLPESLRGRDIGTRMLTLAEDEARRRGCRAGFLLTINFQAPGFYERLGWKVFGEVPCDPPGTSRIFLTKALR